MKLHSRSTRCCLGGHFAYTNAVYHRRTSRVSVHNHCAHWATALAIASSCSPALAAAKNVFVSNGGGVDLQDALDFTIVKGGPDRAYDQFFAAMKAWGRYDLVSSPGDADLILEISFNLSDSGLKRLASESPLSTTTPVMGQIRLVVIDPKTRITLWTIAEYVQGAVLEGNREKNFNMAMDRVIDRLKGLLEPPSSARP